MINMQKQFEVNCSVDFNEVEKGYDPGTDQQSYVVQGTAHFYVEQDGERMYTNGFANPTTYVDMQTKAIRIEDITSFWQDEADDDEIEFNDALQEMVKHQAALLCKRLANDENVKEQLLHVLELFGGHLGS